MAFSAVGSGPVLLVEPGWVTHLRAQLGPAAFGGFVAFWRTAGPLRLLVLVAYGAGWALALAATFAVSHTELFGLRQAAARITGRPYPPARLDRAGLHRRVRHPLMTGLLVVVWAAPTMTADHLAVALTAYVLIGVALKERDLIAEHGQGYADYRRSTPAFLPLPHGRR